MALNTATEDGQLLGWPTPILRRRLQHGERINERLLELIFESEKTSEGLQASNIGTWHSPEGFLEEAECEQTNALRDWLFEQVKEASEFATGFEVSGDELEVTMASWANVSRDGGFHTRHHHVGYMWSGVYYVHCGDWSQAAPMELFDPRGPVGMVPQPGVPFGNSMLLNPQPSLALVFPSWLSHCVHPYRGPGARVSIAFNCNVTMRAS